MELGEPAECALIRGLKEEIGIDREVKCFLGVIENEWKDSEILHYKYSKDLHSDITPISKESHLKISISKVTQNSLPNRGLFFSVHDSK